MSDNQTYIHTNPRPGSPTAPPLSTLEPSTPPQHPQKRQLRSRCTRDNRLASIILKYYSSRRMTYEETADRLDVSVAVVRYTCHTKHGKIIPQHFRGGWPPLASWCSRREPGVAGKVFTCLQANACDVINIDMLSWLRK